jgi:hypothetical protein
MDYSFIKGERNSKISENEINLLFLIYFVPSELVAQESQQPGVQDLLALPCKEGGSHLGRTMYSSQRLIQTYFEGEQ